MSLHQIAVTASIVYFVGFGVVFILRPETVARFGLKWTDSAGKSEVRCYYGALSCAVGGFLAYLLLKDLATEALTGVMFLATGVLAARVIGSTIDRSWDLMYSRQAVPIEASFLILLTIFRLAG